MKRDLALTPERLQAYSRSGNFHSDPDAAARLGYQGMVAQGMQVAGVAYGLLLEAWGDEFLTGGELDVKFVGVVHDGQLVQVDCDPGELDAEIEVTESDRTVVVGHARRRHG